MLAHWRMANATITKVIDYSVQAQSLEHSSNALPHPERRHLWHVTLHYHQVYKAGRWTYPLRFNPLGTQRTLWEGGGGTILYQPFISSATTRRKWLPAHHQTCCYHTRRLETGLTDRPWVTGPLHYCNTSILRSKWGPYSTRPNDRSPHNKSIFRPRRFFRFFVFCFCLTLTFTFYLCFSSSTPIVYIREDRMFHRLRTSRGHGWLRLSSSPRYPPSHLTAPRFSSNCEPQYVVLTGIILYIHT